MATVATKPRVNSRPKIRQTQLLIDGKWCDAKSGKTFATYNPATEEKIADVAEGDAADIDRAAKAKGAPAVLRQHQYCQAGNADRQAA